MSDATRESFGKAAARRWQADVDITGIGKVALRSITSREFTEIQDLCSNGVAGMNKAQVLLLTRCLWKNAAKESDSSPLFSQDDRNFLLDMDTCYSNPLIGECMRFCQIDPGELETLAKNSENGQLADSPTS